MQLTTATALLSLISGLATATPFPRPLPLALPQAPTLGLDDATVFASQDAEQWTIEHLKRSCDGTDTTCTWSFTINTHREELAPTPCEFIVVGGLVDGGHHAPAPAQGQGKHKRDEELLITPASHQDVRNAWCGPYRIATGWSGQFGPENGFTTISVIDEGNRLVLFPAYTDKQLEGGHVVEPDQSYAPHAF
ncbi:hypothetical protein B0T25DRAFT_521705 [Lasiosphaeria hispida]|uniref:Small secreted protein n=1 Tax=Lasiosphaeria hispida TaxID=260671 RepID=A0AAJ0H862_9PEZI|nr:hypothetical protein B0T25DRAFT_521705 [Lasiosphaeria hispida]